MKIVKKNQIIIYVLAFMLVAAGYINYVSTNKIGNTIQTSGTEEELLANSNIGDAKLVSSEAVNENSTNNITEENKTEGDTVETSSKDNKDDYFTTSKLERDTMYSQMIETYEKILNNTNSSETQKQSATEEITKINNQKNSIMICENLIKTKGYDNIIFINGDSVSAIVGAEELNQETVAQIQNVITREIGASANNIHISNK